MAAKESVDEKAQSVESRRKSSTRGRAVKRLKAGKLLIRLLKKLPPGVASIEPINTKTDHWLVRIEGPKETPYEGGLFDVEFKFPNSYPLQIPETIFRTCIYNINVTGTGKICMPINEEWHSDKEKKLEATDVINQIIKLMKTPFIVSPVNVVAAKMFDTNKNIYNEMAMLWTQIFAIHDNIHILFDNDKETISFDEARKLMIKEISKYQKELNDNNNNNNNNNSNNKPKMNDDEKDIEMKMNNIEKVDNTECCEIDAMFGVEIDMMKKWLEKIENNKPKENEKNDKNNNGKNNDNEVEDDNKTKGDKAS